jgi:hypothetical protein
MSCSASFHILAERVFFGPGGVASGPGSSSSNRSITQMASMMAPPIADLWPSLVIGAAKDAAHVIFGAAQNFRRHVEAPFNAPQEI